jgi:hypothetical protein
LKRFPREPAYKAAQSERKRREEAREPVKWWWLGQREPVARFTAYVGVFTALLAVVGSLQWCSLRGQQAVMQGQLAEMQVEQRSWVSLQGAAVSGPISLDQNGARIPLQFIVKNTGKNPATYADVVTDAKTTVPINAAWEQKICSAPTEVMTGVTLLSGDSQTLSKMVYVPRSDLDAWLRFLPPGMKIINPAIVACVQYRDVVTGAWHHTPYAFEIDGRDPKTGNPCCAIDLGHGPVDPKNVELLIETVRAPLPD